jgi:hypothetical protein
MKIRMTTFGLPTAFLTASVFAACSNTAPGIQAGTPHGEKAGAASADPAAKTGRVADEAKVSVEGDAGATKEALGRAGQPKNSASATANTMDAAQETMDIKSALMADKSLDASRINVYTDGATNTVTLTGYVPNAAQKTTANRIVADKAPGYKIVNSLVVE